MVPAWKISEPYPCAWDYLELSGTSPCFVAGVSPAHLSPPTQPLCGNVSAWPRAVKWLCGGGPCGSPSPPPWHISYSATKCWKMGSGEPVGLVLGDETRSPPGLIAIEDQVPAPARVSLAVP